MLLRTNGNPRQTTTTTTAFKVTTDNDDDSKPCIFHPVKISSEGEGACVATMVTSLATEVAEGVKVLGASTPLAVSGNGKSSAVRRDGTFQAGQVGTEGLDFQADLQPGKTPRAPGIWSEHLG
ncbi:hypothetical protein HDU87_005156 [Geranomyces variabilis]|uniref:Uncharacterized protein n=1 Tax=Geranomyces variabilis TaxID=109894 RepID=A0AAD5TQQ7_9FUNG|nr:hypothetical protein HDU87_005156 [Geranomyces variabilis]